MIQSASGVRLKIVRSDGAVFGGFDDSLHGSRGWNIGCGKEWSLPSDAFGNFANLAHNVQTSANVLRDGSSLISRRIEETDRTIKLVYGGANPDAARSYALSFFNPRYGFELHAKYRGNARWCAGVQAGFESPADNVHKAPELTWTLLCLNPFWRSENGHSEYFTDARPRFGFPYVSHMRKKRADGVKLPVGAPVSTFVYDGKNSIFNGGDVPCYYVINCEFDGDVANPVFTKNERFVKVIDQFKRGDVLRIDFEASPPTVTKNGVNCIQKCTRDSNFTGMELRTGANRFQYSCDDPEHKRALMQVQLLYNDLFLGI